MAKRCLNSALKGTNMRFLMCAVFVASVFASESKLPQAPKPYEESPKVEVSGELLFRYERQITNNDSLKRPPKGSQHSLSISVGE